SPSPFAGLHRALSQHVAVCFSPQTGESCLLPSLTQHAFFCDHFAHDFRSPCNPGTRLDATGHPTLNTQRNGTPYRLIRSPGDGVPEAPDVVVGPDVVGLDVVVGAFGNDGGVPAFGNDGGVPAFGNDGGFGPAGGRL